MKKYYRRIAALLPKGTRKGKKVKLFNKVYFVFYLKDFLFLVLAVQAFVLIIALFMLNQLYEQKKQKFDQREQKYIYWSKVSGEYPNAPDVLFNAAKSSYEFGETDKALSYIDKALKIDPLFIQGQKLQTEIGNK